MSDYFAPPATLPAGSSVWGYLRDSGGDGQEQSVPQQRAELRAYCARYGLVLAMVFDDVARSGGSVVGRDGFNDMIDLSADESVRPAGLLLWNFARFARDLDDASYYKALLRKRGLVVHSLTDPIPDGQMGRVVEIIIDIGNEEKRRQTSRDVKRAKRALVAAGYAPGGSPPRGYIAEPVTIGHKRDGSPRVVSRWVEDPELWPAVQLAWRLRAEGKTYEEVQAATGRRLYKSRNCWATFFRNKTYLGIGKAGAHEFPEHHPAAVDQATFDAVQAMRAAYPGHKRAGQLHHPRRVGAPSLLSGLSVCIDCGAAMVYGVANSGRKKNYKWPFYQCGKHNRHGKTCDCPSRRVNARLAEAAVLQAVSEKILTPDYAAALLDEMRAQLSDTTALDLQVDQLKADLAVCERAIANLLELAESFGSRAAATKLLERENEKVQLAADLAAARGRRAAAELHIGPEALELALAVWRQELAGTGADDETRGRRATLSRFVATIELGHNRARIWYTYPLEGITHVQGVTPRGHLAILSKALVIQWE